MAQASDVARRAIVETACEWLITINETPVSAKDRQRFADWLRESPVHVREYLAAEITWSLIGDIVRSEAFTIEASNDASGAKVVPLGTAS